MRILILFLAIITFLNTIYACDMFALVAKEGNTLAQSDTLTGDFNDVTDFFNFIKLRSDGHYQNDGYGIIYYQDGNTLIDSSQKWYKTGYNTWYGDGNYDPLDDAIPQILSEENNAIITLVHARNGTGGSGSHPFLFNYGGKTYSFMHNGSISNQIQTAIINELGEDWFNLHPSNWYGVYPNSSSFIDSELMFHYIMKNIISENDVYLGIKKALNNNNLWGVDFREKVFNAAYTCNFILSDGENIFAFRNSYEIGSVNNLSYELINDTFYALKTDQSLTHQIKRNELWKFGPNFEPESLFVDEPLDVYLSNFQVTQDENTVNLFWQTQSENGITGWNIYRGLNYTDHYNNSSSKINPELITAVGYSSQEVNYSFVDDPAYSSQIELFYWLESIELSGDTQTFGPYEILFSNQSEIPPIEATKLSRNFPNPFQDHTKVIFRIQNDQTAVFSVYNVKGQYIRKESYASGEHSITLHSDTLPAGIYFYRLSSSTYDKTYKMIKIP